MSDLSVASELSAAPAPGPAAPAPSPAPVDPGPPAPSPAPAPADPNAPAPSPAPVPAAEDSLKLPGKDAKPEEWKAVFAKLGAPENADGYKMEVPEGHDPAFSKAAAAVFAEVGLLPQQAERLNKWWNETAAASQKAAEKAEADAQAAAQAQAKSDDDALRNEFQGEKYQAMKNNAAKAMREFFPGDKEQQVAALSALEGVLGYGGLYRMLNKIGVGLAEGSLRGAASDGGGAGKPSIGTQFFGEALEKAGLGQKK